MNTWDSSLFAKWWRLRDKRLLSSPCATHEVVAALRDTPRRSPGDCIVWNTLCRTFYILPSHLDYPRRVTCARRGGPSLTLAAGLMLLATPVPSGAQPAEFLPPRHPTYQQHEALAARGELDSLGIYSKPLARVDIARAVLRARRLRPEAAPNLHFQRLERELAREMRDLGSGAPDETGPLVDVGPRERRFRLSAAGHLRGDFDDKREAAHFRFRDESSATARMSLQLWPSLAAFEELGVTRIRSQRGW